MGSQMKTRTKIALVAPVLAGLVGGLGLGTVAQAHADPVTHDDATNDLLFRRWLNEQGITVPFNMAKYQAQRACENIEKWHSTTMHEIYELQENGGYPFDIANGIVSGAVTTYCGFDSHGFIIYNFGEIDTSRR
jgi:hypothetical protein